MGDKVYTKSEVREIVSMLMGKTFGELNNYQLRSELYNKGSFGHILEEDVFHYGKNSKSAPDLEYAGIELKMTPYKINKNGTLSAKERLVLNIINYMEEYKHEFYDSHFWYKNKLIQIIWYLFEENKSKNDFKITDEILFEFPKDDLPIIINDWYTIIDKIKKGKAHEISESDTMYLGACTKGTNANSVRQQPFSDIKAKQRAFCLKTSYMTQLVRTNICKEKLEKICVNISEEIPFTIQLEKSLEKYKGKTVKELSDMFNIQSNAKSLNEIIVARMLGIKGKVSGTDEFIKANIVPKTIRINEKGRIIESMSFPTFKYTELISQTWEESDLYEMFATTKFMFAVFKEQQGEYYFEKIKFWNMPLNILDTTVKDVWERTVNVVKNGNIVKGFKNGLRLTNFPGMKDNGICHVRPHAKDALDTYPLPKMDNLTGLLEYTKHCFWLNNSFILSIINEEE